MIKGLEMQIPTECGKVVSVTQFKNYLIVATEYRLLVYTLKDNQAY